MARKLFVTVWLVFLLVLLSLTALACGGGGEEEEQATPPPGGSPGATAAATQQTGPKYGGTLNYATNTNILTLDPHTERDFATQPVLCRLYSSLLRLKYDSLVESPGKMEIVGDLAKSWEQTDPTTYVFHLYEGVRFANLPPVNGRELTSEDVKYSFERMKSPSPLIVLRSAFESIASIETPDKYTVVFKFNSPNAPFISNVAYPWATIMPKELVDEGQTTKKAIGSGPFIVTKFEHSEGVKLEKNPDYFKKDAQGNQLPYLDAVDWAVVPDSATRLAAFRSGKLDVLEVAANEIDPLKKSNPDVVLGEYFVPWFDELPMDCNKPPFNDVRVRQAVKFASDYSEYVKTLYGSRGRQVGPVGGLVDWSLPDSELQQHGYNPEKAKALLAEAGYAGGLKVTATIVTGSTWPVVMQDQLRRVGIDVKLDELTLVEWMVRVYSTKSDFQISAQPHYGYADPDGFLYTFFHSKGAENNTHYSNPQVDALLDEQRSTLDVAKRKEIVNEIQRILLDESPVVWLDTAYHQTALQKYVRGWYPDFLLVQNPGNIEEMWLDK